MTVDAHPQTDPAVSVSAAEALVRQLERYGVEYVFGTCGHTNIALLDALGRSPIEFVIARHEQAAAHAADGYARASGRPGVLLVHVGPGMMNAVTGVATAALDSVPLVAIAGDVPSYYRGRHPHQEVNLHNDADQTAIYRPFVKRAWHVHRAEDLGRFTERAFWTATSGRPGAVLLNVPMDLFSRPVAPAEHPLPAHGAVPDLPAATATRNPDHALVLLAHQPRQLRNAVKYGVDLQLSGHTHGGQIWPWHYIVKLQQGGLLAGSYRQGNTQLYVTRGCGYRGPPVRLLAPLEITRVILRSA